MPQRLKDGHLAVEHVLVFGVVGESRTTDDLDGHCLACDFVLCGFDRGEGPSSEDLGVDEVVLGVEPAPGCLLGET